MLASAFEFDDFVKECLESLGRMLTFKKAINCLAKVPEEVRGHEGMKELRLQVVKALTKSINKLKRDASDSDDLEDEEEETKDEDEDEAKKAKKAKLKKLQVAGDALAEALGPVGDLFRMDDNFKRCLSVSYRQVLLKEHVRALSKHAMEAFLKSDKLQCQSEDEFYTLLCCWIYQSGFSSFASKSLLSPLKA